MGGVGGLEGRFPWEPRPLLVGLLIALRALFTVGLPYAHRAELGI